MILKCKDVDIYYEVQGEGEPLLLIHGAIVDSWLYSQAAILLSKKYKVITYDRRGVSRSMVHGEVEYGIEAQIKDVKDLLDGLNIKQTSICGASAGAIIGQHFLENYPEYVKKLIMFEPPLLSLMQDDPTQQEWIMMMRDLIARRKYNTAVLRFMQSIGSQDERAPRKPEEVSKREMGNMIHFMNNEYDVFMDYVPDIEKSKQLKERIIVAVGEKSADGPYPTAAKRFAKLIGVETIYYPGYHNLPSELPKEFALCVMGSLEII